MNSPISVVSLNGNFYPCCDYYCGRPLVGNMNHQTFEYLWNKESYINFRKGTFCSRCKQYHNDAKLREIAKV